MDNMIISSLESLPNSEVDEHFGIITASAVSSMPFFQRLRWTYVSFFGGIDKEIESLLDNARAKALDRLSQAAIAKGANAVVALRLDVTHASPTYCEVQAYGSAIKVSTF